MSKSNTKKDTLVKYLSTHDYKGAKVSLVSKAPDLLSRDLELKFNCKIHGNFVTSVYNIKKRVYPCDKCQKENVVGPSKLTYKELKKKLKTQNISLVDYKKLKHLPYVARTLHKFKCSNHGVFEDYHFRILDRTYFCKDCKKESVHKSNIGLVEYQRRLSKIHGNKYTALDYIKSTVKSKHFCNVHKKEFFKKPNHLKSYGCPDCASEGRQRLKYSHKDYKNIVKRIHGPSIKVISKFTGTRNRINLMCTECNHEWNTYAETPIRETKVGCPVCNKGRYSSKGELELLKFINKYVEAHKEVFPYNNTQWEADICIPSKKLIIEYNGEYFHSYPAKSKDYHYKKRIAFKELGYDTIFVWEYDWQTKKKLVKRLIKNRLGIQTKRTLGARECELLCSTKLVPELKTVYNKYHIQGPPKNGTTYYLKYKNKIVSAMTFSHNVSNRGAKKEKGVHELVRFVSSHNVAGAASKLLSAFCRDNPNWKQIISFSDCDYFGGGLYKTLGFEQKNLIKYDYFTFTKAFGKKHKSFTKLSNLKKILNNFDSTKTEFENASSNGFLFCYNSGKIKWLKINCK